MNNKTSVRIGMIIVGMIILTCIIIVWSILTPEYNPIDGIWQSILYYAISILSIYIVMLTILFITSRSEVDVRLRNATIKYEMTVRELENTIGEIIKQRR